MKKTFLKSGLLAIAGIALMAGSASAGMIYADSAYWYNPDGTLRAQSDGLLNGDLREDPDNALGAYDGDFLSLGLGGAAVFSFAYPFDSQASVVEVTWDNTGHHSEAANVYVWSQEDGLTFDQTYGQSGSNWEFVDAINNEPATPGSDTNTSTLSLTSANLNAASPFLYLAIVDTTLPSDFSAGAAIDGFDIGSVSANVPEPATMMLFGAGLAGLAGIGRRRKK